MEQNSQERDGDVHIVGRWADVGHRGAPTYLLCSSMGLG